MKDKRKHILLLYHVLMVGIGFGTAAGFAEFLDIASDTEILHAILALVGLAVGSYSMLYLMRTEDNQ